jgi:hypothetical protein
MLGIELKADPNHNGDRGNGKRRNTSMHFKPLERHELDKIATAALSRVVHA